MTKLEKQLNELRLFEISASKQRNDWISNVEKIDEPFLRMLCRDRVIEYFEKIFKTLSIQIKTLESVQEEEDKPS